MVMRERERERGFTISQEHSKTYKNQRKSYVRPKFFNLHILIKPKSMQLKIIKRSKVPLSTKLVLCVCLPLNIKTENIYLLASQYIKTQTIFKKGML